MNKFQNSQPDYPNVIARRFLPKQSPRPLFRGRLLVGAGELRPNTLLAVTVVFLLTLLAACSQSPDADLPSSASSGELKSLFDTSASGSAQASALGDAEGSAEGNALGATQDDTSSTLFTRSTDPTTALLAEIQALAQQRQADLTSGPGWLYWRARVEGEEGQQFFEPKLGLNKYELEEWLYLDQAGIVTAAVRRIFDPDQQPVHVFVLKDGVWTDLTVGANRPDENPLPFDPNHGFSALAADLVQRGRPIHSDTIYHDCWYQGERFTVSDGQNYYEAVFNPHRKSLRWIKTYHLIDGSIQLVDSLEMMIEKRIPEPPGEILALLEASE